MNTIHTSDKALIISWRRSLSYRNQFTDLLCKSMDWFLYDRDLHRERVKTLFTHYTPKVCSYMLESTIRLFCLFLFYLGFLSWTFTIHRTAGEGGGYLFISFLPLSWVIGAGSSPLLLWQLPKSVWARFIIN